MIKETPLVSVVIVTYKPNLDYFSEAINSVKNQTYKNIEIIIINDKSSENVELYFNKLKNDKNITYICNETRMGVAAARNQWILECKWKYIAMLDDDDFRIDEKKVEKQVEYMENHNDYWLVWVKEYLSIYEDWGETHKKKYRITNDDIKRHLLWCNSFAQSGILIRKSILAISWIYDTTCYTEDYELWCRIWKYCKICNIDSIIWYRVRKNSLRHGNLFKWKISAIKVARKYRKHYPNSFYAIIVRIVFLVPYRYVAPLERIKGRLIKSK